MYIYIGHADDGEKQIGALEKLSVCVTAERREGLREGGREGGKRLSEYRNEVSGYTEI